MIENYNVVPWMRKRKWKLRQIIKWSNFFYSTHLINHQFIFINTCLFQDHIRDIINIISHNLSIEINGIFIYFSIFILNFILNFQLFRQSQTKWNWLCAGFLQKSGWMCLSTLGLPARNWAESFNDLGTANFVSSCSIACTTWESKRWRKWIWTRFN